MAIPELSDEDALLRLRERDKDALGLLFDRHSRLLFTVAYRVLGDRGEAEELVQNVFLHLFERATQFDPVKGAAKPWIVQIAYHRALDRRTYLVRRRFWSGTNLELVADTLAGDQDLDREIASRLSRERLERALEELPEKQRIVLQLYFFEGMELREISEKLDESLPNVRHSYYRGLEKLRNSIFVQQLRNKQS